MGITLRKSAYGLMAGLTLVALASGAALAAGGPLEPPGPPGPTFKTLDEVEPRIPISSLPYTINQSGSYYLTHNLTGGSFVHGITIDASNVTLDLMGYTLQGSGSQHGIHLNPNHAGVTLRNGAVRGWDVGVNAVNLDFATQVSTNASITLENLRATNNTSIGLAVGNALVIGCTASGNSTGINPYDSTLVNCTTNKNLSQGIQGTRSTITACTASQNGGTGINVGDSTITGCTVNGNASGGMEVSLSTVSNCTLRENGIRGILAAASNITGCMVSATTGSGIVVFGNSLVARNHVTFNTGAGISVQASGTRVEENTVISNDSGISVSAGGNLIIRNSASANPTQYSIAGGNQVGPIVSDPATAGPWANFQVP